MRIVYHHRTMRSGVEGVHIAGVINALTAIGHDVTEVALVSGGNAPRQGAESAKSGRLRRMLSWIADRAPNTVFRIAEILYNPIALYNIVRMIRRVKPAFIYERYAYFNFAGVLAAKLCAMPILLEVNIVTTMQDTRKLELSWMARFIERKVLQSADALFVVSDYLKRHLIEKGIDASKIHVQPNAFSTCDVDTRRELTISNVLYLNSEGKVVIGFLGRLLPWYKLDVLLKVFRSIHDQFPLTYLVFIGDGTERQYLESIIHELGLKQDVFISGMVSHAEALALLQQCNIGVIPSTNVWTSPVKLFEYMGMGLPVIAPDITSVTSIMTDGIHGIVFPYEKYEEFEKALISLITNSELRKSMGERARNHVILNYTWEKVAENIITCGLKLLDAKQEYHRTDMT